MTIRRLILLVTCCVCLIESGNVYALKDNTFSGSLFLGDSYAPNNFRLSFRNFDLGYSDIAEVYFGSRLWRDNFYAGFGVGLAPSVYGMVGYEWRFISWAGLTCEFDGDMTFKGTSAGRVYIGIVAGW